MKNLNEIVKKELLKLRENKEHGYMFIQDIETMHKQLSTLVELMQDKKTEQAVRDMMQEHEWAVNHLATSKDDIEEVFNFIMNSTNDYETINRYEDEDFERRDMGMPQNFNEEKTNILKKQAATAINMKKKGIKPKNESYGEIDESENTPTNSKLWAASLAWAKSRYDVCPSAYCNGAAAKRYKSKGGGWRKSKK